MSSCRISSWRVTSSELSSSAAMRTRLPAIAVVELIDTFLRHRIEL